MTATALYRHYDDEGTLLYVGISLCPAQRLTQHRQDKSWYQLIHSITVEWHATEEAARAAETAAIKAEVPVFNVKHADAAKQALIVKAASARADAAEAETRRMREEFERQRQADPVVLGANGFVDAEWLVRSILRQAFTVPPKDDGAQVRLCH